MAVTPVRMLSPRIMVVCPTATPGTSVMALRAPVGRMPTLRPKSEARGRGLGVVFWAAMNAAVNTKTVTMAKNLLRMRVVYGQNTFENGERLGALGRGFFDWQRRGVSERFQKTDKLPALRFGQLGPDRHATADDTVCQNPENCARFGALDFRDEKTGASLSGVGFTAVPLGAMLREQYAPGGDRFAVVPKRIFSGAGLVRSFFDFSINGVFFLRCAGKVLG